MGNVGVNRDDEESRRIWVAGFAVRDLSPVVSNYRSEYDLHEYLNSQNIVGVTGISTRALVKHIRMMGAMRAALSSHDPDPDRLVTLARTSREMNGADLAIEVTCKEPSVWEGILDSQWLQDDSLVQVDYSQHIVAMDFGIKHNILRLLRQRGCRITVVPATTTAEQILALHPNGVFLSNGPGDPAACDYAIQTVRALLGKTPIFGICLGHQILGLALGGTTRKMKFGHRGGNQPVTNKGTHAVEISSHNHGFEVTSDSLPPGVEITHVNLNDGCIEGLRATHLNAFSVQYHPEASPGPHDATYLFDEFMHAVVTQPS